jgi:hypothetical protein
MRLWRFLRRVRKPIVLDGSFPDSDFERWMVAWLTRAVHGRES